MSKTNEPDSGDLDALDSSDAFYLKHYANKPIDCDDSPFEDQRFIDFLNGDRENQRAPKIDGYKTVIESEEVLDQLNWFKEKRAYYRKEFLEDCDKAGLLEIIPRFISAVQNGLYDGKSKRLKDPDVIAIKRSIWEYLDAKRALVGQNIQEPQGDPMFSQEELQALLDINKNLIHDMFGAWLSETGQVNRSTNDIYFRRGIHLKNPLKLQDYSEKELIVCHSLSITVAEQFALINSANLPHILRMEYNACYDSILYSSLLIPTLDDAIEQYEFGVIPMRLNRRIKAIGEYKGMLEYKIEWEGVDKPF